MAGSYRIVWARTAERDLLQIIEYIALDSPKNAGNILNKIKKKTSELEEFPQRGRVVPELQSFGINQYYEIIVSPWRIIYRITQDEVYVLSVFDSRRNVEDILLGRFMNER